LYEIDFKELIIAILSFNEYESLLSPYEMIGRITWDWNSVCFLSLPIAWNWHHFSFWTNSCV